METMMRRTWTFLFLPILSVLFCAWLWAHEGSQHILGTVTAVLPDQVVVQTLDNKTVTIMTTAQTRYRMIKEASTREALKVGHRVVAEITKDAAGLTASELRFSAAPAKPGSPGSQVPR
jgi:hypothetical protein